MFEIKDLTPEEFRRFQTFIYDMSGIRIPDNKRALLSNRVRRRVKAGQYDDFQSYYRYVTSPQGESELTALLDAVTTNETSFFRTEKHFDWFRDTFVGEVVLEARRGQRPKQLRIWSAACSTGEEPYSIAICLAENRLRLQGWKLEVVATDLSGEALEAAREGLFAERTLRDLDDKRRRRHFTPQPEGRWQIKPVVSELVSFHHHNLLDSPPRPSFDCVFIRNVLIYFDRQSKQRVVDNLIRALAPGGWLVVGPSEGIYDMLGPLDKKSTFLYQRPAAGA